MNSCQFLKDEQVWAAYDKIAGNSNLIAGL